MLLAGVLWTFWIGVVVMIVVAFTFAALAVGYLVKATSIRYPPGEIQRRVQEAMRRR